MSAELYTITTRVTIEVVTLVRAESKEAALAEAKKRPLESSWQETVGSQSALSHWLFSEAERPTDDDLARATVRVL